MSESKQQGRDRRAKRTPLEGLRWWWNTRIRSLWTVRLPAMLNKHSNAAPTFAFKQSGTEIGDARKEGITAILTVYKRGEYLSAQIDALRQQSIPPTEIWVWCNDSDVPLQDVSELVDRVIVSNSNWKFWGRFALANMVRTPYISLFDDDILPQTNWLKNCLATYATGLDGILGGSGVLLPAEGGYSSKNKVGWNGHHVNEATRVDLVGHAWFFKKEHLKYMWQEQPMSWENGEDIHLSCMAWKHAGIGTYVPPHPANDESLWSCRPDFGKRVGRTSSATFKSAGHHNVRDEMVDTYRKAGWRIVADESTVT
jgi:hypothetical protein